MIRKKPYQIDVNMNSQIMIKFGDKNYKVMNEM